MRRRYDEQGEGDGGEPRPLGDALSEVSKELGLPDARAFGRLVAGWATVVGETLARHASPRGLRDGVLTVAVDVPAWATQVRYLERDLLEGCAALAGPGVVERLRVVVDPAADTPETRRPTRG